MSSVSNSLQWRGVAWVDGALPGPSWAARSRTACRSSETASQSCHPTCLRTGRGAISRQQSAGNAAWQASPLRCVDGSGTAGGLQCARSCGQADAPSVDAYGSPIVMYVGSLKYPRLFMAVIVGSSFCGRAATGQDQAHMQAGAPAASTQLARSLRPQCPPAARRVRPAAAARVVSQQRGAKTGRAARATSAADDKTLTCRSSNCSAAGRCRAPCSVSVIVDT